MQAEGEDAESPRRQQLGHVIHNRRLAVKLTLAQLSEHTGLSQSFLSQLENGRTNASLRSLQRISDALATTATELLAAADPTPDEVLVRATDNTRLDQSDRDADGTVRSLTRGPRNLRALEFTGGTHHGAREFTHPNDELIYVVTGAITLEAHSTPTTLTTGDSYYCPANTRHRWWAHTPDTITLLLTVAEDAQIRRSPHKPR
ncbi:helix-turn-helix domain-containing protein [Nocardia sp. NBC_01327]|uniref:helix-turn-helix domain-containing protein n=1 Tax=Nocardia sp. NBC_01327 TaxID=2903593 RepID=UPI002E0FD06D|nr:helix-turn-helix domain-containing protein [Nocardia sp. NBC_01327]